MICIEGIIGAGKTTLCNQLQKLINNSRVYLEPVGENPYLEKFYKDKSRWGLEMQYYLMAQRYKMHQDAILNEWNNGIVTIFDRSIYGDKAFADILHNDGSINDEGYKAYMQHRECMEKQLLYPQVIVFLNVPVCRAIDRINKRGRDCEKSIPAEYLEKLNDAYFKIISDLSQKTTVLSYDWKDNMTADDILTMTKKYDVTMSHKTCKEIFK